MSLLATAGILIGLAGLALLAYSLRALDAWGASTSFVLGVVVAFAGGPTWVIVLVAFTGVGFVATRYGREEKHRRRVAEANDGERGARNVLANGAAPALAAVAALFLDSTASALAFTTAVAAHTADTLASEVGSLAPRVRRILPPFAQGQPGDNGCISTRGQIAAALGAAGIAAAAALLGIVPLGLAWVAAVAGWIGCQLDSILGATLERDALTLERPLSKGDVNFLSAAVPAFVVLVAASLT